LLGNSRRIAAAMVDFPDPLSPTSPMVVPLGTSSETPCTALTLPRLVR
jgi:hypothetical protein